jgi:hypothetical protein
MKPILMRTSMATEKLGQMNTNVTQLSTQMAIPISWYQDGRARLC